MFLSIFLLMLGINKELDLQTHFILYMRDLALKHDWYANRTLVKKAFVFIFCGVTVCVLVFFRLVFTKIWKEYALACLGVFTIIGFVILRVIYFNHDAVAVQQMRGQSYYQLLELIGLAMIAKEALKHCFYARKQNYQNALAHVYIDADGSIVNCPKCNFPAHFEAKHLRTFKCKSCGTTYTSLIKSL